MNELSRRLKRSTKAKDMFLVEFEKSLTRSLKCCHVDDLKLVAKVLRAAVKGLDSALKQNIKHK